MMSYTALAANVDALLAIAICWLLASACMLICACKIVLSSCSSSRVFLDHCNSSHDYAEYLYFSKVWHSVYTDTCPHHKEFSAANVVLAQLCLLQGSYICCICVLSWYKLCILTE